MDFFNRAIIILTKSSRNIETEKQSVTFEISMNWKKRREGRFT